MASWQTLLSDIRGVQTEIMRIAPHRDAGLVPNPRSSRHAIAAAEQRLGHALPPSYRAFLTKHDGWPRFFEGATLLGTANLGKRCYEEAARATFDAAETPVPDLGPPGSQPTRRVLIPFGIDLQATTIFAFNPSVTTSDGEYEVIAWVNEIGMRYDSFTSFLQAVLELSEAELSGRLAEPMLRTG
jgi:SMI1 / KNR4 family (SUKH-1)